jgi:hypothetical protein
MLTMSTHEKLEEAASRANDMVLAMSFGIIDTEASPATQAQSRAFQPLFAGVRNVLSEASRNYWEPGSAPDDWETFDSSRAVLSLADAILAIGGDR